MTCKYYFNLIILFVISLPIIVPTFLIAEMITYPLKKFKLLKWDEFDYVKYLTDSFEANDSSFFQWKQESFYKIKYDYDLGRFAYIKLLIPMFSPKVYLTVDANHVDLLNSEPIMTDCTIKTNVWNWNNHKEKIINELKLKRNEIMKQKIKDDFE